MRYVRGWWLPEDDLVPESKLIALASGEDYVEQYEDEMRSLSRKFGRSCVVVDAAAWVGCWTAAAARYFARVEAYEASPSATKAFARNVQADNVRLHVRFLTYREGPGLAAQTDPFDSRSFDLIKDESVVGAHAVQRARLDDVAPADAKLLRLGRSPMSLSVLKGGKAWLMRCKPAVLLPDTCAGAMSFLSAQGYKSIKWVGAGTLLTSR